MSKSRRAATGVLMCAGLLAGCSSGVKSTDPQGSRPSPAESSRSVGTSTAPSVAELGPSAFRVDEATRTNSDVSQIRLVGPPGATLRLRVGRSKLLSCRQVDGINDELAGEGLPSNSTQHYELKCQGPNDGNPVVVLVTIDLQAFTYNFQVPVTFAENSGGG